MASLLKEGTLLLPPPLERPGIPEHRVWSRLGLACQLSWEGGFQNGPPGVYASRVHQDAATLRQPFRETEDAFTVVALPVQELCARRNACIARRTIRDQQGFEATAVELAEILADTTTTNTTTRMQ